MDGFGNFKNMESKLPELPQVNFITRNRGIGCPVYDRLPPATAIYGNSAEATP